VAWQTVRDGLAARAGASGATNAPPLVTATQFVFDRLAHDAPAASNRLERLRAAASGSKDATDAFHKLERSLSAKGLPPSDVESYFKELARRMGPGLYYMGIPSALMDAGTNRLWELTAQALTNDACHLHAVGRGRHHETPPPLMSVALAHVGELAAPAGFALVDHTPAGRELYERLAARFGFFAKPPADNSGIPFGNATMEVLHGILVRDGLQPALDFAGRLPKSFFTKAEVSFSDGGVAEMDFIERMFFPDNLEPPTLNSYASAAMECGETARASERLMSVKSNPQIRGEALRNMLRLAAFDDDEAAIVTLAHEMVKDIPNREDSPRYVYCHTSELGQIADIFAATTNRDELVALADAVIGSAADPRLKRELRGDACAIASALGRVGLDGKAFDTAVELLVGGSGPTDAFYETVLPLYRRAGRYKDIVDIVDGDPCFIATNAMDLVKGGYLGLLAVYAEALAKVDRGTDAVAIAREVALMWHRHQSCGDWPFKILADEMETDKFTVLMDSLYEADRFEERPLVWKAEALRRAGRLAEAEPLARKAVEIDPTDGETRAGDRIRSYSVLADILAERSDAKGAEFLRNAVRAVRLAEEGDELQECGLIKRSLAKYEEAEKYFSAAYCVQWRKAERLRELGRVEEATRHYEETFRQLPTQFGFVASLCFGCFGIFDSPGTVSIAEGILSEAASGDTPAPAACYLLGKLREEQGRHEEAFEAYARATALAPEYLDAYVAQNGLRFRIHRPLGVWEGIQARIFALDPLGRHSEWHGAPIIDWGLAMQLETEARRRLPAPDLDALRRIVFPASARRAAEKGGKPSDGEDCDPRSDSLDSYILSGYLPDWEYGGKSFANSRFVHDLCRLVDALGYNHMHYMYYVGGEEADVDIPDEFLF
jgi:tetratricopeptide (TPR) repeat protein